MLTDLQNILILSKILKLSINHSEALKLRVWEEDENAIWFQEMKAINQSNRLIKLSKDKEGL